MGEEDLYDHHRINDLLLRVESDLAASCNSAVNNRGQREASIVSLTNDSVRTTDPPMRSLPSYVPQSTASAAVAHTKSRVSSEYSSARPPLGEDGLLTSQLLLSMLEQRRSQTARTVRESLQEGIQGSAELNYSLNLLNESLELVNQALVEQTDSENLGAALQLVLELQAQSPAQPIRPPYPEIAPSTQTGIQLHQFSLQRPVTACCSSNSDRSDSLVWLPHVTCQPNTSDKVIDSSSTIELSKEHQHQNPSVMTALPLDDQASTTSSFPEHEIAKTAAPVFASHTSNSCPEPFPEKLYRLLEETEAAGKADIISFTASGLGLKIHRPKAFEEEISPLYFKLSKVHSFKRQLNHYGFKKVCGGPEEGAYSHRNFQKGRQKRLNRIRRVQQRQKSKRDDSLVTIDAKEPH